MDALRKLCTAGQQVATFHHDRLATVSDCNGDLVAVFCCPNAITMADALVALPELLNAMDVVEGALAERPLAADTC